MNSPGAEQIYVRVSSWPAALASLFFSATTLWLFSLYSFVHWQVLAHHFAEISPELRQPLMTVLNRLESYRLFAVAAFVFASFALVGTPRWPAYISAVVALLAMFSATLIQ